MPVEAGSSCAEARGSNLASRLPWKLAEAPCISFAYVHMLLDSECQHLHGETRCGHYSQVKLKQPGNLNRRNCYFWLLDEFDCVRYSRRVCRGCCAEASWKLSGSSPSLHSRVQGSFLSGLHFSFPTSRDLERIWGEAGRKTVGTRGPWHINQDRPSPPWFSKYCLRLI